MNVHAPVVDVSSKVADAIAALDSGRPVLLKMGFDPGWQTLKDAYAFTAAEPTGFPSYTEKFNNFNPSVILFKSAIEFAEIYHVLRVAGHVDNPNIRVGFKNDQRPLSSFVIDSPDKMKALLRQMTQFDSKPFDMSHDGQMHNFPRCFYFGPEGIFKNSGLGVFNKSEGAFDFAEASIGLNVGLLYLDETQRAAFNSAERVLLIASPSLVAKPTPGKRIDMDLNAAVVDQVVVVNQRGSYAALEHEGIALPAAE